jgi:hypothetical protein
MKSVTKRTAKAVENENEENIAASYNKVKKINGQQYTGMKVGRSHKWYYDKGIWKETKVTPDRWELT